MATSKTVPKEKPTKSAKQLVPVRLKQAPKGVLEELPDLELHAFDDRGRMLGVSAVHGTKAELHLPPMRSRLVRAVLAPAGMSSEAVHAAQNLPSVAMEVAQLELVDFDHNWWDVLMIGAPVWFHGTVEKVLGDQSLPICEGTVEVYEVDPWKWVLTLPDLEVHKLRDDLLDTLRAKLPDLRVLEPGPVPPPIDPPPIDSTLIDAKWFGNDGIGASAALGLKAAASDISSAVAKLGKLADPTPQPALQSLEGVNLLLLAELQGAHLRNYLTVHKWQLLPYLCLVPHSWFYVKQKLTEVEIQPDGTFSGFAGWWLPGQDRPDLYFKVKQTIGGTDKYIYCPPVACHTWWDYAGQLVPIRVHDVEAIACDHTGPAIGNEIVIFGIGFDTTTDETIAPGELGTGLVQQGINVGLFRYGGGLDGKVGPYGQTLHVALDVDPAGMQAAGARFYRISWKAGQQATDGGTGWEPLTTPIARHHKIVTGTDVTYPLESLTPTAAELPAALAAQPGIFKLPPFGLDYKVIKAADRAFGIWDTTELHASSTPGAVAGVYTLRIEVFGASGNDMTNSLPFKRISKPLSGGGFQTTATTGGEPLLYVHVDNRPMVADINDLISAGTSTTTTGCGFLHALPNQAVDFGVKAFHPAGIGFPGDPDRFLENWSFRIRRGSAAVLRVNHVDTTANVGSPVTWYPLPNGGLPTMTVNHLLDGVTAPPGSNRRCAFEATLYVNTLTRNGYGKLDVYDARDSAAFALIDDRTV